MTAKKISKKTTPPAPASPPPIDGLPHPLTIFVDHRDRQRIITALRRLHRNRATALTIALGLRQGGDA